MVQDWRSFYDPAGGRDITNTGGFFAASLAGDVLNWTIVNPMLKKESKTLGLYEKSYLLRPSTPEIGPPLTHSKEAFLPKLEASRRSVSTLKSQKTFWRGFGWATLAAGLVNVGESLLSPGISKVAARQEQKMMSNETPFDSAGAYTQRQRALQAIHDSQSNIGRVLSNESRYLHK